MDIVHLSLFLLLTLSFNHASHRNLVSAADVLIKLQCKEADVPTTCIQCVKSDPRSQSADKVGIAAIVITCLSNDANILTSNMSSLASSIHDKDVQLILKNCKISFDVATRNLVNATTELNKKDYDETNSHIGMALQQESECKANVNSKAKIPELPSDVMYRMRVYEELSVAAMRMIDRF